MKCAIKGRSNINNFVAPLSKLSELIKESKKDGIIVNIAEDMIRINYSCKESGGRCNQAS